MTSPIDELSSKEEVEEKYGKIPPDESPAPAQEQEQTSFHIIKRYHPFGMKEVVLHD